MDYGKVDFHPYITKLRADLIKYHSTMSEPTQDAIKNPYVMWQQVAVELWEHSKALEARIEQLETAALELSKKPVLKRPVISATGYHKGYLHSDGTIHPYSEDC